MLFYGAVSQPKVQETCISCLKMFTWTMRCTRLSFKIIWFQRTRGWNAQDFFRTVPHVTVVSIPQLFLKSLGIRVMNWPGNSPDLNSIENVWSKMKYDLREMDCSTKKKLIENIKKVWNNLPREYWVTLADSMPRRIQAVIDNQGGPTKY